MKASFPVYNICHLEGFKHDDIMVSRFGPYLDAQHKTLHLPHRHSFYHLVLFTEGTGYHTIDFRLFTVRPGQIYFMAPGQVHSWDFEGRVDGYVINFSANFFRYFLQKADYVDQFSFFSGSVDDCVLDLPAEPYAAIKGVFEKIIAECDVQRPFAADMVRLLMLEMFILAGRLTKDGHTQGEMSYNQTLLRSFQRLTDEHFTRLRLPKDYAELLYITPNHLNALCNDVLGISAGEVIRRRIALEAKRLLVSFDLSIGEIAAKLNFQDNSNFSKFFKKQEGITPEEFRKNIKTQGL